MIVAGMLGLAKSIQLATYAHFILTMQDQVAQLRIIFLRLFQSRSGRFPHNFRAIPNSYRTLADHPAAKQQEKPDRGDRILLASLDLAQRCELDLL